MKIKFQLQLTRSEIPVLAKRYAYTDQATEAIIIYDIAPKVKTSGLLSHQDFLTVCEWKTQRSKSHVRKNTVALVEETSRLAFSTEEELLRIGLFTLLKGVNYPTASVFLHFFHEDPYPILDVRALEALGVNEKVHYTFDFWWDYVQECRKWSNELNIPMRTLDRALWQWSLENEK